MERVDLPTGITINGNEIYFREKPVKSTKSDSIQIDTHLKKPRSIKGKAFLQERKPGKRQRVTETIIYDKERVKAMEMEKYHQEFQKYLLDNWQTVSLANLAIAAICIDSEWKPVNRVVEIFKETNEQVKRTISKSGKNSLGYVFTSYLSGNRALSLFIEKDHKFCITGKASHYKVNEMGVKLGPAQMLLLKLIKIPNDFEKLRLKLSDARLYLKTKGVSEFEFNKFIKKRFDELNKTNPTKKLEEPFVDNDKPLESPIVHTIEDESLKNVVENMPLAVAPEPSFPLPLEPETFVPPENVTLAIDSIKPEPEGMQINKLPAIPTIKKISFDIKVWFIPVTGVIELS